nr:hypothetical protein [Tolypothrix carrinoi HA7290-LM1]
MHQPKQLQLFDFPTQPQIKVIHDPYWDELEAQADDIVEQAFLSINAEDEIFDVDQAPSLAGCGRRVWGVGEPVPCGGGVLLRHLALSGVE